MKRGIKSLLSPTLFTPLCTRKFCSSYTLRRNGIALCFDANIFFYVVFQPRKWTHSSRVHQTKVTLKQGAGSRECFGHVAGIRTGSSVVHGTPRVNQTKTQQQAIVHGCSEPNARKILVVVHRKVWIGKAIVATSGLKRMSSATISAITTFIIII